MPKELFVTQMIDYILSGHAYLHVQTHERTRFLESLKEVAQSLPDNGREVFTWSPAVGWQDLQGNTPTTTEGQPLGSPDPQQAPREILSLPENSLFVLRDFGFYVHQKTYSYADLVTAWLCEIRDVLAGTGRTVIFLDPTLEVPESLAHEITSLSFPLPDDTSIESSIRYVMDGHDCPQEAISAAVSACRGMTQQEVEDRTALALRKHKTLDHRAASLILHEKAEILRRGGLLKYVEPPGGGLSLIGGNENVKQHIIRDKTCFSDQAKEFGIDPPRGVMLTGISGCGKTQISLCAASELGIPLIQFDVGSLMSKWVGETESNLRTVLQQVESMAPCVLQMDEIEKGFGSVGGSADSGASLRAFGTLLKWMSERTCPVYLVMTANDVSKLPPEFTRKGRIDEIYGIYLPDEAERQEIFCIHLDLKQRDPGQFDLVELAHLTEGYTGADIREVVLMGLKLAFHAQQELDTQHFLQAIPEIRPLSKTDPERVTAMTAWLGSHTRPASNRDNTSTDLKSCRPQRKVTAA